jgi:hypothetical protein
VRATFSVQFDKGELGGAVDGDEQIEPALCGSHFGDVDVEVADRIGLELALGGRLALDLRQPRDAVALQTAVQGRACEVRNGRLERVEAVVQSKQRMPAERDDDGFRDRQDRGPAFFRAGRDIGDRYPLFPFGDRLLVDAVSLGERPQALLTMLYRSTDRLCRGGAPVQNLTLAV